MRKLRHARSSGLKPRQVTGGPRADLSTHTGVGSWGAHFHEQGWVTATEQVSWAQAPLCLLPELKPCPSRLLLSRAKLSNVVATTLHGYLYLNEIKWDYNFSSSAVPMLCNHLWLPHWTAERQNISIIVESPVG